MRHLLTLFDMDTAEIERVFAITKDLKSKFEQGLRAPLLPGRMMALLFEKKSLRTRVSFQTAMTHLGGGSVFLGEDVGFGSRESVADFGRALSEYVDVVVVRSRKHQTVLDLAEHCTCSVINGLTDFAHPCQALADIYTLTELIGPLRGQTMAWVGDGNNVARSLSVACAKVGMRFVGAMPPGYGLGKEFVDRLKREAPEADIAFTTDPARAVAGAAAVYTDVWVSMGQENELEARKRQFADYQVNAGLMSHAPKDAYFMHCLPAKRGLEVTDEVIDGPRSIVVQQAGNRLRVQKGILAWLLDTQ